MEQSNEKLTEFTSNLKYKIEATAPDSNHLRVVRRHDNSESHIDLMTGRVVMLANQKYTIIKHISRAHRADYLWLLTKHSRATNLGL